MRLLILNLLLILFTLGITSCEENDYAENEYMDTTSSKAKVGINIQNLETSYEWEGRDEAQQPDKIIELLGDPEGKVVMDLGAGSGYFTFKLADKGFKVIAADVDKIAINYLQEKVDSLAYNEQITVSMVEQDDPFKHIDKVDYMLIVNTYRHIDKRVAYFKAVREGLNDGGKLIIIGYKPQNCIEAMPPVEARLATSQIVLELQNAGFAKFNIDNKLLDCQYVMVMDK